MQLPPFGTILFCDGDIVWMSDMMRSLFKCQTRGQMGIPITMWQCHYIDIALDCQML